MSFVKMMGDAHEYCSIPRRHRHRASASRSAVLSSSLNNRNVSGRYSSPRYRGKHPARTTRTVVAEVSVGRWPSFAARCPARSQAISIHVQGNTSFSSSVGNHGHGDLGRVLRVVRAGREYVCRVPQTEQDRNRWRVVTSADGVRLQQRTMRVCQLSRDGRSGASIKACTSTPPWASCRWAQPAAFYRCLFDEGSLIESQLSEPLTCSRRPSQDADVTCTRRGSLEMRQVKVNWDWIGLSPPTPVQYSTLKYSVVQTNERPASSMHGSNESMPSKRTPTLKRASLLRW
jgi:hypothetical protein